jgi:hypothetical protein
MPNALAHIAVQGPASRLTIPGADLKWVFLGLLIPDLPWIFQRVVLALPVEVSAYDLRLYTVAQSSLFMCLILSAGLAAFSRAPWRVFAILGLNSLLHLLLDATEVKWGAGVHLFAPFSWHLLRFDLLLLEGAVIGALTVLGLVFFAYVWWRLPPAPFDLCWPRGYRAVVAALALSTYLLLPPAFFPALQAADSHYVATLLERSERPGRLVEFDRRDYVHRPGGDVLVTWAGEELDVAERVLDGSATVSVRARFIDESTIEILELQVHPPGVRDAASYVGLLLILAYWARSLWGPLRAGLRGRARSSA